MDLEGIIIMLRETSSYYCVRPLHEVRRAARSIETESRAEVPGAGSGVYVCRGVVIGVVFAFPIKFYFLFDNYISKFTMYLCF